MEHHRRHRRSLVFDYLANFLSSYIISESNVVTNILSKIENVPMSKIYQIPPAIDLKQYFNVNNSEKEKLIKKYFIQDNDLVIGICSRFDHYKGINYIIDSLGMISSKYKNIKILFFGASGNEFKKMSELAAIKLPVSSYKFIKYEKNIVAAYSIMDIFIHVPIAVDEEAFGLVYIESMASAIACIFTISGIAEKLLKNERNALVVKHKNSDDIHSAIEKLIINKNLRKRIGINARKDVIAAFPEEEVYKTLSKLYKNLIKKNHFIISKRIL